MRLVALIAIVGAGACGGRHPGGPDAAITYESIAVEPAQATVTVALGSTASQAYQVFGVQGTARTDITSRCTLTIEPAFGYFTAATAMVAPHGGKALVTATCGALTGHAELQVNLTGTVVVGPNTPPGAPGLFGGATLGTDAARTPLVEYPLDGAVSPVNIPSIETQWTAAGNDLFHVALTGSYATIDVYTTDVQAILSATDWDAITRTVAGGNLGIVVEGLAQATPATKYASARVRLVMSHDEIDKSAIYYWASSQGSIMSQTFGDTGAPSAVEGDCSGCHSLSRSGSRLGYSRCVGNDCGQLFAGFMRFDPQTQTWTEPVNANDKAIHGSYTTFSPLGYPYATDAQSLAIVSMADGTLALYDPDTGTPAASNLAAVASHGPGAPRSALMADWSPSGREVVYASTPHGGQWIDLGDSAIAKMQYDDAGGAHTFGEPTFLVQQPITLPGGTYSNFFFPSFSPDGKLVVFDAARGGWRNFNVAGSPGQRLMLTDAGGAWTVDLTALNGGNVDSDITWPHWAPGATQDYYWIVFSSERDYGHEVTRTHTAASCVQNGVQQCKQIWIGAIAKSKVAGGAVTIDPSAPPMWLPGQDPQTDNISPFWTVPTPVQ